MLLVMAIFASIAACLLVVLVLVLVLRTNSRLTAMRRRQDEEFAFLRRSITELRQPAPDAPPAAQGDEVPRIGAREKVLQVGDHVVITDGPHRGGYGTIIPSPEWLRAGMACVDLAGGEGPRYVEVSKLARLDEVGRG